MNSYGICITILAVCVVSASCLPVELSREKREGAGKLTGAAVGAVGGGLLGGPIGAVVGGIGGAVVGHELHKHGSHGDDQQIVASGNGQPVVASGNGQPVVG